MQKTTPFAAIVMAMTTSTAFAQGIGGITHEGSTLSLGLNVHNDGVNAPYSENYTTHLSASSSYSFGSGIGATVTLAYSSEEFEDDFFSERFVLDINPTYDLGSGTVGVFYSAIRYFDGSDADYSSYGVTGQFDAGAIGLEGYFGVYDEDGSEYDILGLAASYDVTSSIEIYGAYRRDTESNGDFDAATTLGLSYSLASISGHPLSIAGETALFTDESTALSESEWDQYSVFVSYDFGNGASSKFRGIRGWTYYYD